MKHKEQFLQYYYLDEDSPTGLKKSWVDEPAGYKQRVGKNGYVWVVQDKITLPDGSRKRVTWSVPHVLYELSTGETIKPTQMIVYGDVNKDNLKLYNLSVKDFDPYLYRAQKESDFNAFRTVILSRENPDYFKPPEEWTTPQALEALRVEREKRAKGESVINPPFGRPRKWK